MRPSQPARIPTPPRRWWQEARTRYFPRLVMLLCVCGVIWLWRAVTGVPSSDGQVILVSSDVSGVLSEIKVSPYQPVKAGDSIASITIASTGPEQEPVVVLATSDGVVSSVYRRRGELVEPGEPIVAIAPAMRASTPRNTGARADRNPVVAEVR